MSGFCCTVIGNVSAKPAANRQATEGATMLRQVCRINRLRLSCFGPEGPRERALQAPQATGKYPATVSRNRKESGAQKEST
jgi:hypothetical protein